MIYLNFVALDDSDEDTLLDEDLFLEKYTNKDSYGFYLFESAFIDEKNISTFFKFIFKEKVDIRIGKEKNERTLIDLTAYQKKHLSVKNLENEYSDWLKLSGRENSMSEYGNIICILGYLERNSHKQNLYLIIE